MENNLGSHSFEIDNFLDSWLKFKHEIEAVMTPYKVVYKAMQNKVEQSRITLSFHNLLTLDHVLLVF